MTSPIGAADSIFGRIDQIERSLGVKHANGKPERSSLATFDPFGEAYQKALAGPKIAPGIQGTPGMGGGYQQFATRLAGYNPYPGAFGAGASLFAGPAQMGMLQPSRIHSPGGYGKLAPPPHLAAQGNGRIDRSTLTEISQGSHRLEANAAASWRSLVAKARAEGIDMTITDSYRDYDQQVDLVRRKGLYSQGGLGARPGTSNHGWGLAVDADVTSPTTLNWLRENGPKFGWLETVPREPWHWEFRPHQV